MIFKAWIWGMSGLSSKALMLHAVQRAVFERAHRLGLSDINAIVYRIEEFFFLQIGK